MIGRGEVEFRSGFCFDHPIAVELSSVVGRDGVSGASGTLDQTNSSTVRSLDGTSLELADHHVARLMIDEGEDAVLVGASDEAGGS